MSATFKIVGLQEKAPKLETSQSGKKYLKFSLTVTSQEGRKTWFNNITLWDDMAEKFSKETKEGQTIELEGNLYIKMDSNSEGKKQALITLDVKKFKVQGQSDDEESTEEKDENPDDVDFDSFDNMP